MIQRTDMTSTTLTLHTKEGNEAEAHLLGPDDAQHGILILHDWWGVLPYNLEWAERLAALGYKVLVLDLYDGEKAVNAEEAGELMRNLDQDMADSKILAALDELKQGGRKVTTLGWSLGGRQAMLAALLDPETVSSTILFYCRMVTDADTLQDLGGPVLAIYASQERTWPEKMEKFSAAMEASGKSVENHTFDAEHGFINPGSNRYNEKFHQQAWELVMGFLQRAGK